MLSTAANRSGAPARLLNTANLLHQAFFDEATRPAVATDPLPASPPDMAELQRALGLAPKYNMFFAPPASLALRPMTSAPIKHRSA